MNTKWKETTLVHTPEETLMGVQEWVDSAIPDGADKAAAHIALVKLWNVCCRMHNLELPDGS